MIIVRMVFNRGYSENIILNRGTANQYVANLYILLKQILWFKKEHKWKVNYQIKNYQIVKIIVWIKHQKIINISKSMNHLI